MRKLTPEEREKLQKMLQKHDVEKDEKKLKLLKRNRVVRRYSGSPIQENRQYGACVELSSLTSKGQELIDEGQKQGKRSGRGLGLKRIKLTEKEKKELEAKIRGTS